MRTVESTTTIKTTEPEEEIQMMDVARDISDIRKEWRQSVDAMDIIRLWNIFTSVLCSALKDKLDIESTLEQREEIVKLLSKLTSGGHSTRQSYDLAGPKFLRIRETHGKKPWRKDKGIEVYVKTFSQMAKWLDEEIAQEITLDKHNPSLFPPPHHLHRRHLVDRSHPK